MVDLRSVREAAGISQNRLARMCGVVRQTIGEIESGRNRPSVMLSKQFGVILNIDWVNFFDDIQPVIYDLNCRERKSSINEDINRCLQCKKSECDNCMG